MTDVATPEKAPHHQAVGCSTARRFSINVPQPKNGNTRRRRNNSSSVCQTEAEIRTLPAAPSWNSANAYAYYVLRTKEKSRRLGGVCTKRIGSSINSRNQSYHLNPAVGALRGAGGCFALEERPNFVASAPQGHGRRQLVLRPQRSDKPVSRSTGEAGVQERRSREVREY